MELRIARNRIGILGTLFALLAAACLMLPATASALTVDTTTARSNESSGDGIIGGSPTRITWEGTLDTDEEVTSVTFVLPEGTVADDASIKATVLDDLDRIDIDATTTLLDDGSILIEFDPIIPAESLLRIEIEDISLPEDGGDVTLTGTYLTSDDEVVGLPESPVIHVEKASFTESVITWLDDQAWVDTWNSSKFREMFLKPQLIVASLKSLFWGWLRALALVLCGFPLAIPIGLCISFVKMSRFRIFRALASLYINVIRGTPLFLQIYIAFFGLPLLGVTLNDYVLGIAVLAMNSSAYLAEIFRAGIQSINKGQFEAASSLGMNSRQTMFSVIIPQTVRRVIPTMTSEFILLYKDTSLLSSVGIMELMMFSKNLSANSGNVTPYIVAAFYYLLVTLPLIKVIGIFERKLALAEGGGSSSDENKKRKRFKWKPAADEGTGITPAAHDCQ